MSDETTTAAGPIWPEERNTTISNDELRKLRKLISDNTAEIKTLKSEAEILWNTSHAELSAMTAERDALRKALEDIHDRVIDGLDYDDRLPILREIAAALAQVRK